MMDLFAAEYGWDTDKMFSLTTREVEWRAKAIMKRRNAEFKFNASIHGIDINTSIEEEAAPVQLTEEQKTVIERQRAASLVRIQNRHG